MSEEAYLEVSQIVERLRMSPAWVRRQVALGTWPVYRLGTRIRVKASDLEKWEKQQLERRRVT